jgi:predicted RNA-binding protein with PUA-like domain
MPPKKKAPQIRAGPRKSAAKKPSARKPAAKRSPAAKKSPAAGAYATSPWAAAFAPRAEGEKRYWLVKSEPGVFSFDDLLRSPGRTTCWDGVRNFAARNFLRDGMKLGDRAFFYHSMADAQSIVGICEVVGEGYADHTALDPAHPHYDPGSDPAAPTWYMVDLRAVAQFTRPVALPQIKARPELEKMALLRIGRLSVTPVTAPEWAVILRMAE